MGAQEPTATTLPPPTSLGLPKSCLDRRFRAMEARRGGHLPSVPLWLCICSIVPILLPYSAPLIFLFALLSVRRMTPCWTFYHFWMLARFWLSSHHYHHHRNHHHHHHHHHHQPSSLPEPEPFSLLTTFPPILNRSTHRRQVKMKDRDCVKLNPGH